MKFGFRKPSLKKKVKAKTSVKRNIVQRGGLKMPKGKGFLRSPKKAVYNKVYNKTTIDPLKMLKKSKKKKEPSERLFVTQSVDEDFLKKNNIAYTKIDSDEEE